MATALTVQTLPNPVGIEIERVLIQGDLAKLTVDQRLSYYNAVCVSVGINPLTRPFEFIALNGKLVMYAKRDCTDQLRKIHGVSISDTTTQQIADCFVVKARATDKTGRTDESTGIVPITNLRGNDLANAMMKAETKAKRRVTLSICGLGFFDESEVEGIADVDPETPDARNKKTQRELGTLKPSVEPNRGHGNEGLRQTTEDVICNECRVRNGHADKCPNNPAKKRAKKQAEPKAEEPTEKISGRERWLQSPGHKPEAHISFDDFLLLCKVQKDYGLSEEQIKAALLQEFEIQHRYLIRKEEFVMVLDYFDPKYRFHAPLNTGNPPIRGSSPEDIQY